MKNNENDKIVKMYENIDTPEYDVKDKVLNSIREQKHVPRLNKRVLIAAVLILAFLLVGSAAATGALHNLIAIRRTEPLYTAEVKPTPTATPIPPDGIQMHQDYENDPSYLGGVFCQETKKGEFRVAYSFDEAEQSAYGVDGVSDGKCSSYEEMKAYFNDDILSLPFPQYIPDGYNFVSGVVTFYVDESILEAEVLSQWTEGMMQYTILKLPDGYEKKIAYYEIVFENKEGNNIEVRVNTYDARCGKTHEFSVSQTAVDEYVNVAGHGEALLIYETERDEYKLAFQHETIEGRVFCYTALLYDISMKGDTPAEEYVETLGKMTAVISSDGLSKEEIIQVAEGMK